MSLLDDASLLLTPNAYKEGKLYSVIPSNGNGDFTATRATTATRVNSAGLVDLVPYNLLTWSEMFSNAAWTKTAASVTANTTTAPDGTLTADSFIEDNTTAAHQTIQTSLSSAGGVYTSSIYLKPNGRSWAFINITAAANYGAWFDFQNGVVGTIQSNITTATITSVGNGWFRCTLTANTGALSPRISLNLSTGNNVSSYAGNGTSGLFIWGAQLVEGTSARDYLRTETRLNIPRIDYSLGGCPNILLEPQRTNLALQSSSFDSASWVKANITATANTTTSPSGVVDADTVEGNGVLLVHQIQQNISYTTGLSYSASIYAKKNTNNFIQIVFAASTFGANAFANFDLNSGAVGTIGSSATARIENVGNGWYRCIMTATATATGTAAISIGLITSATSVRNETNTLSTSVFLWGAQLEAGAYATSFIPTTTASVTRNADSITRNNIFTNGLITASGGTWFVELRNNVARVRDSQSFFGVGDTTALTTNSLVLIPSVASGRLIVFKAIGGSFTSLFTTTTDTCKIAIKWNGATADVFQNGVKVVSATAFTPTNMNILGNPNVGVPLFINEMALFPTPLTDAQCIALTQ